MNKNIGSRNIISNTLSYSIGSILSKILLFLLVPVLSFFLDKDVIGNYDIILTTVAFFIPIVTLEISSSLYKFLLANGNESVLTKKRYYSSSFLVLILTLLLFLIVSVCLSFLVEIKYFNYGIIMVLCSSLLSYFQKAVRGEKKVTLFSKLNVLNSFMILIFSIGLMLYYEVCIEMVLIATILANILSVIYAMYKISFLRKISFEHIEKDFIKKMLFFSVPLIPNVLSWWIVNMSDKYLILYNLGSDFNGVYAISSRFPGLLIYINSIFILAWQDFNLTNEELKLTHKKHFNNEMFLNFIKFQFSIILILISSSKLLMSFMVGDSFFSSYKYMGLIYIGVAFSAFSSYIGALFLKENMTKELLKSSVFAGITNLIISFTLINKIGLFAPALGTFVSYSLMFFVRYKMISSKYNIKLNYYLVCLLTFLAIIFTLLINIENFYIQFIMFFFSLILMYIMNKKVIKIIKSKIV